MTSFSESERILVFAPSGRDADLAKALLREGGHDADIVTNLTDLVRELSRGAGMAVIADEAILTSGLRPLTEIIGSQEPWSDFPILILTKHGAGIERNPTAARLAELLGNVTFLERPFHPTSMISIAKSAIRARRRQYEARARLVALSESQERLSLLTTTLEQRVDEEVNERRRAEEALLQAHKMEALGQLTGGIAHDFNNLLMAVMGNLDLLRKHLRGDPRFARLIDGAMQGAQRGATLTRHMLAFARQQELTTDLVDLSALCAGMENMLERTLGPQFKLELSLADQLPAVKVDPTQIELAILNLCINARDAMTDGGRIVISTDFPDSVPAVLPAGRYVRLSISDSGAGMSEETLKKATEPFFSTKPVGKGTGLGLSMVHGLALQLGGLFQLDSRLGEGTTATIWLPALDGLASDVVPLPEQAIAPEEAAASTILMVDDDLLIGMATSDMLQDLGHTVIEASSGKMALDILMEGTKVDLMITDHAMPGMTGVELANRVRENYPELPILLATGYADLPSGERGEFPRLTKPYDQSALSAAITKLLRKSPH
ncbi:MAG: response regulator [Alphaproteobacteria bacterium]|nr:response regulator [Alphaproteobacteria bacterium]